ncbi:MAG: MipA/OmpV family protein [Pseudomonadota bacterium]|nr:MipA/OmpV family protein [Pseudomonadota bacterium]
MRVRAACVLAGVVAGVCAASPSFAQQNIDEPKLDPFFGKAYREPKEPEYVQNDDEFDNEGWSPLRGMVGILTFMTPETTNLSLGVGPIVRPDYFGSNDYELAADPQAYVKFRNFLFLADDGADFALFGFSRFSFGPTIRLVRDREESDNSALVGLGDVGRTFEFGGFAATTLLNRYSIRFKVRHGLKTGHRGTIVDASTTALLFRYGRLSTSLTAQASWIGNRYADAYFTVTPEQSLASGLPEYDANAGFRDIGGSFNAYINIGKRWSLNPYFTYNYIFDNIADTPIIALEGDRNQYTAGFHIMREFKFRMHN